VVNWRFGDDFWELVRYGRPIGYGVCIVINWRFGDVSVHHVWTAVRVELFCLNVCARAHVGGCGC
jgi:hypothetical protein